MNEDVIACGYKISFKENGFEASAVNYRGTRTVYDIALVVIFFYILPLLALCVSILGFVQGEYPHAIFFAFGFLGAVYMHLMGMVHGKKEKCFRYIVDENGITNVQVNGTYHINWNEVACYGFVDNVPNGALRDNEEQRVSCLVVSTEFHEKKKLRKRISRPSVNWYGHINSNDFICVDFLQLEMTKELQNRMLSYFHRYMGEDVEGYDKQP